jgi:succinyl-CoA synthetase alpha subunit
MFFKVKNFRLAMTRQASYESNFMNMKISSKTKVICQGFTGKQGTYHSEQAILYGTNMVGGVSPKYNTKHLGLPVFKTVQQVCFFN